MLDFRARPCSYSRPRRGSDAARAVVVRSNGAGPDLADLLHAIIAVQIRRAELGQAAIGVA